MRRESFASILSKNPNPRPRSLYAKMGLHLLKACIRSMQLKSFNNLQTRSMCSQEGNALEWLPLETGEAVEFAKSRNNLTVEDFAMTARAHTSSLECASIVCTMQLLGSGMQRVYHEGGAS